MKKWFRKLAVMVVTIYANYLYRKAVRIADKRHAQEKQMIYVASKNFHPDYLTTYDRARFKREKKVFGFHARLLTLQTLKNGCYYHTPDRAGNQAMSEREKERRRLYFIRERLIKARLKELKTPALHSEGV